MQIFALVKHFFKAGNEHSLHSPFLFEFYNKIKNKKLQSIDFQAIESIRRDLKASTAKINVTDFGAGSKWNKSNLRAIKSIAKTSEKEQKLQIVLHLIIKLYFKDAVIVELGTSLGITTAYLAMGSSKNNVYTFEGCPEISKIAIKTIYDLGIKNIELKTGNIDETLPSFLASKEKVDFVLFDANHRYEPTIRYFEQCLAKATNESIFVFDDIYWSSGMQQAWNEIKRHESVTVSFDFYQIGIVFFKKELSKQHFKLRL